MTSPTPPFGQTISGMAKTSTGKTQDNFGQQVSDLARSRNAASADAKTSHNQAILQSSLALSVRSGDEAMALLYRTALDGINEALKAELGDNAIQKAYEQGLDVSPEVTADRIVQMSTAFFDAFYSSRQHMSPDEALEAFVDVIGRGIDQGFAEARQILDGLNVLEGDIASNIDRTYQLVQQGLQDFVARFQSGDND